MKITSNNNPTIKYAAADLEKYLIFICSDVDNINIHLSVDIFDFDKVKGFRLFDKVKGFRLFDKVKFESKECFIFGRRSTGYFDLRTLDGNSIHKSASYKKLEFLELKKSLLTERRMCVSSHD